MTTEDPAMAGAREEGRVARITRADDPRLADYRDLTDVALRGAREVEHGLFVAEGQKIIERAITAGHPLRSVLCAPRWVDALLGVVPAAVPILVADEDVVAAVAGFHVHRGALASCERPAPRAVAELVRDARRVVVLEDLADHTNVGLVFRSAAALGIDAIVLTPRCADPLYRRAIKTSMGATLGVPWARMADWYGGVAGLQEAGLRVLGLTPDAGAERLEDVLAEHGAGRLALVLGSEGDGMSERWLRTVDHRVRIAQRPGVDSLNVAAAAAIACYLVGEPSAR